MFKYIYILLIFAFLNVKAEEPNLIWERSYHDVHSMFLLNDTTLIIQSANYGGVTYFVNQQNGIASDSIIHKVNDLDFNILSPNKKVLVCGGKRNGILIDLENKKFIKNIECKGDIAFKDDENIYVFFEYGIYLQNILTGEKELIFEKEVYHPKYGMRIEIGPFGSKFNSNGKYALVIYDKGYLVNLETKEEVGSVAGPNDTYVFNPKNPDELVVYGGEQMHFYNTKDSAVPLDQPYLEPYKKVYFDEHIIGDHYGSFSEDGKYFAIDYLGWIRIYDLETKELKNKVYKTGVTFNLYNNFVYLNQSARQYKYDISSYLSVENQSINEIEVFPNPNNGNFKIEFNNKIKQDLEIEVLNQFGEKILIFEKATYELGEHIKQANLSQLSNGMYYVRFKGTETNVAVPIVIMK